MQRRSAAAGADPALRRLSITARFIANAIGDHLDAAKVTPLQGHVLTEIAAASNAYVVRWTKAAIGV
jgi:hypothetical protein